MVCVRIEECWGVFFEWVLMGYTVIEMDQFQGGIHLVRVFIS